jgi:hypothetical protein
VCLFSSCHDGHGPLAGGMSRSRLWSVTSWSIIIIEASYEFCIVMDSHLVNELTLNCDGCRHLVNDIKAVGTLLWDASMGCFYGMLLYGFQPITAR